MNAKRNVRFEETTCWSCKAEGTIFTDNSRGDTVCCGCGMVHQSRLMNEDTEVRTSYGDSAEQENRDKKRSSSGDGG